MNIENNLSKINIKMLIQKKSFTNINIIKEIFSNYSIYLKMMEKPKKIKNSKLEEIFKLNENLMKFGFEKTNKNYDNIKKRKIIYLIQKSLNKIEKHFLDEKFNQVFEILIKIWQGKKIKPFYLYNCDYFQILIIESFVKRKFGKNLNKSNYFLFAKNLKSLNKTKFIKRDDEKIKFVILKFLDLIKKIHSKKKNFLDFFFDKYLKNFIPKEYFLKFFSIKKSKKIEIKRTNQLLLKMIFSSDNLKDIYLDFHKKLKNEYLDYIKSRTKNLLFDLQNLLIKKDFIGFENYLFQINFCVNKKIPWTFSEIDQAFRHCDLIIFDSKKNLHIYKYFS